MSDETPICIECGNCHATEGLGQFCLDCQEKLSSGKLDVSHETPVTLGEVVAAVPQAEVDAAVARAAGSTAWRQSLSDSMDEGAPAEFTEHEWVEVGQGTRRMRVHGGWIYSWGSSMVFVPDRPDIAVGWAPKSRVEEQHCRETRRDPIRHGPARVCRACVGFIVERERAAADQEVRRARDNPR